jgi:hypothetical protein
MIILVPVEVRQYRFAFKIKLNTCHIGIFHSYAAVESSFAVDLYIKALTPADDVPAEFASLLALPDLKRGKDKNKLGLELR